MTYAPHSNTSHRGISLVEVVITAALITTVLLTALVVTAQAIGFSRRAINESQAALLLEEGVESVKIVRDNSWATITGLTNGQTYYPTYASNTWSLSTTPNTVGIFTRTVVLANAYRDSNDDLANSGTLDTGTKYVTVTVSWSGTSGTVTKTLSFYISDILS